MQVTEEQLVERLAEQALTHAPEPVARAIVETRTDDLGLRVFHAVLERDREVAEQFWLAYMGAAAAQVQAAVERKLAERTLRDAPKAVVAMTPALSDRYVLPTPRAPRVTRRRSVVTRDGPDDLPDHHARLAGALFTAQVLGEQSLTVDDIENFFAVIGVEP